MSGVQTLCETNRRSSRARRRRPLCNLAFADRDAIIATCAPFSRAAL
jgi:hypothetical protein